MWRSKKGGKMEPIKCVVPSDIHKVETLIKELLSEQGFGVLSEIDVASTLKAKLNIDRAPLKILGACNPSIAHRALDVSPDVALLMPCNVVLEEKDGTTEVSIVNPKDIMPQTELADLANEAYEKLTKVKDALAVSTGF